MVVIKAEYSGEAKASKNCGLVEDRDDSEIKTTGALYGNDASSTKLGRVERFERCGELSLRSR